MSYKQLCVLLLVLVFFGCTKNEAIDDKCLLPEDYGLVDFVEPPDLVGWHPYQNNDTITFAREDSLKKSFRVLISDTLGYSPLTCFTPCPNNPEEWGWIQYTSQYISVNLKSIENEDLTELSSTPSEISIRLSSNLLIYNSTGNADFVNIDINSSRFIVTDTGLNFSFNVTGIFPHNLNGNENLDKYKLIPFIEFNGVEYNNIYESSCSDCDEVGKVYYSKEHGIIAFFGKDELLWHFTD